MNAGNKVQEKEGGEMTNLAVSNEFKAGLFCEEVEALFLYK